MNAFAEGFVGSIKRGCLSRMILFGAGHLGRALDELVAHCHRGRPHQGVGNCVLTPGAAEALVVKAYRHARTKNVAPAAALNACLEGYQNPVPADVLELQMRLAVREATDLAFVPPALRHLAAGPSAA